MIFGAVRRGDVEHMNLAITRDFLALAVERHAGVVDALVAGDFLQDRAGVNEHPMLAREILAERIGRAARQILGGLHFLGARAADEVETFGQTNPIGFLLRDRLFDERFRARQIGGLVVDRIHLDQGDFHAADSKSSGWTPANPRAH